MTLTNVFDHYRQHLSRMVKRSTREDYNKRLAMLSKYCAMHNATTIEDIDFTQFLEWVFIDRVVARSANGCVCRIIKNQTQFYFCSHHRQVWCCQFSQLQSYAVSSQT